MEEMLGSDATKATLRGFQDLRFRGPHLLLLQAEYRFKVKGPLDATVFVDAGEVTTRRSALTLTDMSANIGFSTKIPPDRSIGKWAAVVAETNPAEALRQYIDREPVAQIYASGRLRDSILSTL